MLDGQRQAQARRRRNRLFLPALAPIPAAAVVGVLLAGPDRLLNSGLSLVSDLNHKITSLRSPAPVGTAITAPPQTAPGTPPSATQGDAERLATQSRPSPPTPTPAETQEQPATTGPALPLPAADRTYDPAVIGGTNPAANTEAAAAWYKTAADLDSAEASARQQKK